MNFWNTTVVFGKILDVPNHEKVTKIRPKLAENG